MNVGYANGMNSKMPDCLSGHISEAQWHNICVRIGGKDSQSCLLACAGEGLCCLISGCFCVFCCHSYWETIVFNQTVKQEINALNRLYFHNYAVLHAHDGQIFVNSGSLPPMGTSGIPASHPAGVQVQTMYVPAQQTQQATPVAAYAVAMPQQTAAPPPYTPDPPGPYGAPPASTAGPYGAPPASTAGPYGAPPASTAGPYGAPPPPGVYAAAPTSGRIGQYKVGPQDAPGHIVYTIAPDGSQVGVTLPDTCKEGMVVSYPY